jgi:hypothetical protein
VLLFLPLMHSGTCSSSVKLLITKRDAMFIDIRDKVYGVVQHCNALTLLASCSL